jgi:hypothetical protein
MRARGRRALALQSRRGRAIRAPGVAVCRCAGGANWEQKVRQNGSWSKRECE